MRGRVTEQDPRNLGESVRFMREAHGWTGQFLASKIYVDQSRISRIESGEASPNPDQLRQLADALGVSIDALVRADVATLRAAASRALQLVEYDAALDKATRAVARWMLIRAETPDAPDTPADVLVRGTLEAMSIEDERIAKNAGQGCAGQPRRVPYNLDEFGLDAPPRSHPEGEDGWHTTLEKASRLGGIDDEPTITDTGAAARLQSSGF